MDVLDDKTERQLADAMLPELAKAMNEVKCARQDLDKATGRLSFLLLVVNNLINRQKD